MAGRNKSSELPIEEQVSYDPDTGIFTWIVAKSKIVKGSRAGGLTEKGYRKIKINGKKYFEHRLAVYFMTGSWPEDEVDHINHVKDDNRWENLRPCTGQQNCWDTKGYSNTGYKGVHDMGDGRYRVKGHRDKHLCYVRDAELGALISYEYRAKYQGDFVHG